MTTTFVADGIFTTVDGRPNPVDIRRTDFDNHMFARRSGCLKCMADEQYDVAQLQDTEPGSEIMHMAENGCCEHGDHARTLAWRRRHQRSHHPQPLTSHQQQLSTLHKGRTWN